MSYSVCICVVHIFGNRSIDPSHRHIRISASSPSLPKSEVLPRLTPVGAWLVHDQAPNPVRGPRSAVRWARTPYAPCGGGCSGAAAGGPPTLREPGVQKRQQASIVPSRADHPTHTVPTGHRGWQSDAHRGGETARPVTAARLTQPHQPRRRQTAAGRASGPSRRLQRHAAELRPSASRTPPHYRRQTRGRARRHALPTAAAR